MEQFRMTVSLVLWAETTDEASAMLATITNDVPEDDRANLLATIEFVEAGRPVVPTVPESV